MGDFLALLQGLREHACEPNWLASEWATVQLLPFFRPTFSSGAHNHLTTRQKLGWKVGKNCPDAPCSPASQAKAPRTCAKDSPRTGRTRPRLGGVWPLLPHGAEWTRRGLRFRSEGKLTSVLANPPRNIPSLFFPTHFEIPCHVPPPGGDCLSGSKDCASLSRRVTAIIPQSSLLPRPL